MPVRESAMTAEQFNRALARLDHTAYSVAPVLGISRRMAYRYADGSHPVPQIVANFLRALLALRKAGIDLD